MRIGIDVTPLTVQSPGGIGTSLYETIRALTDLETQHEFVLYACGEPRVPFSGAELPFDLPVRIGSGLSAKSNIVWLQFGVAELLRQDRIDVFWGTRHVLPRNSSGIGLVATAYDFWYVTHPEQQPFVNRTLNRYVIGSLMSRAHVVTAISDATAEQARQLFPHAADRVRTVLLGVDREEFSPPTSAEVDELKGRLGIKRPYLLAMDVYNPRKNFEAALRAAAEMTDLDFEIVALGRPRTTAAGTDIEGMASELGLSDRLHLIGDIPEGDLRVLYGGASVFVYLSHYEGFGMPVLEAMSAGVPVVSADTSSLPQVAGDAALLVAPTDIPAIAGAIRSVLTDDAARAALVSAGTKRSSELTWQQTAHGMLAAFDDAAAMARRGAGT